MYLIALSRRAWDAPQPVPFNHDTHTAEHLVGMPCLACHPGAEQGAQAGMPADSTCLDCHRHILAQDPRLLPLHAAADPDCPVFTAEPLRWSRSQPLPAYVHFTHAVHAAKYDCSRCHPSPGQREAPQLMRDCLHCHRSERLPLDCSRCHR